MRRMLSYQHLSSAPPRPGGAFIGSRYPKLLLREIRKILHLSDASPFVTDLCCEVGTKIALGSSSASEAARPEGKEMSTKHSITGEHVTGSRDATTGWVNRVALIFALLIGAVLTVALLAAVACSDLSTDAIFDDHCGQEDTQTKQKRSCGI